MTSDRGATEASRGTAATSSARPGVRSSAPRDGPAPAPSDPAAVRVLSVLAREPGASGADLARALQHHPPGDERVLATLEREALIERQPHPRHGRILQATLTTEGQQRLEAANPSIRAIDWATERDFSPDEIATVRTWLVATAQRLERATESSHEPRNSLSLAERG
jgi:DNA-binding MarR family transcriptional regulator